MPARPTRPRPTPQPDTPSGDDLRLADDAFALGLADDGLALAADEGLTLVGDTSAREVAAAGERTPPHAVEREAAEEVSEILEGFRNRESAEAQRFEDATDTEYWVALCFQTREQKEEFLRKMGWLEVGDKYLDGIRCAEISGVTLESRIPPLPTLRVDRQLADLT